MLEASVAAKINLRIVITISFLLLSLGMFTTDMYLPSMPAMVAALHTSSHSVQLTITYYLLGFTLSQLIYGPLSDSIGRRRIILTGISIGIIGSIICVLASTIHGIAFGRLVQGVGIGAGATLARTIARDVFSGTKLAQIGSFMGTIMAIVPAAAPIIGGYVQTTLGWQANFGIMLALNILMFMAVFYYLPETNQYQSKITVSNIVKNYFILLTNKTFMGFALCTALTAAGLIAYLTVSPFLIQNVLGLSPIVYGWLALFITCALVMGSLINAALVNKLGLLIMITAGLSLMLLGGVLMLLFALLGQLNIAVLLGPMIVFIMGSKLIYANAFSGALEPFAKMAGAAGAMYGCIQILGTTLVSGIMSIEKPHNQLLLAWVLTALGVIGLITFYKTIIKNRH